MACDRRKIALFKLLTTCLVSELRVTFVGFSQFDISGIVVHLPASLALHNRRLISRAVYSPLPRSWIIQYILHSVPVLVITSRKHHENERRKPLRYLDAFLVRNTINLNIHDNVLYTCLHSSLTSTSHLLKYILTSTDG